MPLKLFDRYKELQAYVAWTDDDAARIKSVAAIVEANTDLLIADFYAEIQRHPEASRVFTGGQAQITRLMVSLHAWLKESFECHSDVDYVQRRWKIGLRHAEIGLNPAYTSAAMSRLRNGLIEILSRKINHSSTEFCELVKSLNKLLDLDLSIIQDAYEAEYISREKFAERERSEVKFRQLVEAAACMVVILRENETIAYFSPYSEELTGHIASEVTGQHFLQLFVPEVARADASKAILATLSGQPTKAYEIPILHRDGRQRWFVWNAQLLDDFEGRAAVLDRESEVRYLAERVGIKEVFASQSPEQKVDIVRRETAIDKTVFLGDGINDAPALTAATVGLAFGQNSDVTSEAADAVIMDSSLEKIDEFIHIGRRMRRIALESAVGGMALSMGGMLLAAAGYLPPVAGAVLQEVIDIAAVLNALRMALPPGELSDFERAPA